jgi:hypothetical protein
MSRSPAAASRKKNDRRNGNAHSKSRPHSGPVFFSFQNLGNDICKFHNFYPSNKPPVTALSHVSVPTSPQQQRHLAFISEFNVQMLYLPCQKNVVADFLSRTPPPSHRSYLELSALPRWQIQLTL